MQFCGLPRSATPTLFLFCCIFLFPSKYSCIPFGFSIFAFAIFTVPFVFKNSLDRSTISFPLQYIFILGSFVTFATTVDSIFSFSASFWNFSTSFSSITTAILSCDSDIASSVPSNPSYFFGTLSRFISNPSASSPIATETPPAPKSLHLFISVVTSGFLNNLCIFLSSGAFPFCTSAPHVVSDALLCAFDEPVAPPHPSLPVLPPNRTTTSPGSGTFLFTFFFGAAPTNAPISSLLATYPG